MDATFPLRHPQARGMLLSGTSANGTLGQPLFASLAVAVFFLGLHCTLQARTRRYGKFSRMATLPLISAFVLWYDQGYAVLLCDNALLFGGMAFLGFVGLLRAAADSNALHSLALIRQGYVALPDPHRDEALIAL